jgi:hypothetical protein
MRADTLTVARRLSGLLTAAALVFLVVAWREWDYRRAHPYAHGVSGELIALSIASAVTACAAAFFIYRLSAQHGEADAGVLRTLAALQQQIGELRESLDEFDLEAITLRQIEHDMDLVEELGDEAAALPEASLFRTFVRQILQASDPGAGGSPGKL